METVRTDQTIEELMDTGLSIGTTSQVGVQTKALTTCLHELIVLYDISLSLDLKLSQGVFIINLHHG